MFYLISVPQQGTLIVTTEFGKLSVAPNEICVIQVSNHSTTSVIGFLQNYAKKQHL